MRRQACFRKAQACPGAVAGDCSSVFAASSVPTWTLHLGFPPIVVVLQLVRAFPPLAAPPGQLAPIACAGLAPDFAAWYQQVRRYVGVPSPPVQTPPAGRNRTQSCTPQKVSTPVVVHASSRYGEFEGGRVV